MRLVDHDQAAFRPGIAHALDDGLNLAWVMAIVVHQRDLTPRYRVVTIDLEPAANAGEVFEGPEDVLIPDAFVRGHGDGGHGVQNIVAARHAQPHIQVRVSVRAEGAETGTEPVRVHVRGTVVGILAEPVSDHGARDALRHFPDPGVVTAHDRDPVERKTVQEFLEGLLELLEIPAVRMHVIRVDVGDDADHRCQVQEGGVAFVGLRHQVTRAPELGVGAGAVELAPDHEGRVQAALAQNGRDQAGGGGLAMGAGHGNAMTVAHDLGQHLGARNHRHPVLPGHGDLGIGFVHGAGDHDHVRLGTVLATVTNGHPDTKRAQMLGHGAFADIGAGDLIPLVVEHFRDPAHAGTADAHEVDPADAPHLGHIVNHGAGVALSHELPPDSN